MIPKDSMEAVKQQGIPALQQIWSQIAPQFSRLFRCLNDWGQTAYMPTGRIRTPTWVADGAVLIGDAAHAMNPHASQGRMQAMVDAMALADLLPSCLNDRNYSAERLKEFERARRPQVTMLQQLADQQVFYWNTKNPVVSDAGPERAASLSGSVDHGGAADHAPV
jgi:2-polyprenyl-6-methoxyphenol hydroxylase-like FAD-dependent oxidoreductase